MAWFYFGSQNLRLNKCFCKTVDSEFLYSYLPFGAMQDDVPPILLHHPLDSLESQKHDTPSRENT